MRTECEMRVGAGESSPKTWAMENVAASNPLAAPGAQIGCKELLISPRQVQMRRPVEMEGGQSGVLDAPKPVPAKLSFVEQQKCLVAAERSF